MAAPLINANVEATRIMKTYFDKLVTSMNQNIPANCVPDTAKAYCASWTIIIPHLAGVEVATANANLAALPVAAPQVSAQLKSEIRADVALKLAGTAKTQTIAAQVAYGNLDENTPSTFEIWAKAQLRAVAANALFGGWPPK